MSEEMTDYERRDSEERRVAFGHAVAELCNQWSMMIDRDWLPIRAQMDGYEVVAKDKVDVDGDIFFDTRTKEKEQADGASE